MNNRLKILPLLVLIVFSCKSAPIGKTTEKVFDANEREIVTIRWTEMYKSVCCPKDLQHDDHILNYINEFELKYNIKIKDSYKIVKGREGEANYYLSLNGLDANQIKHFIEDRYLNSSKKIKKIFSNLNENPVLLEEIIKPWKIESVKKIDAANYIY